MIIGQDEVKNKIQRVFEIFINSDCEIRPHFFLTGNSGSGKTYLIETLCNEHKLPMISINAAQLTKEGVSGNSLSKALTPLLTISGSKPIIIFVDEYDKLFLSGNSNSDLAHESTVGVQNEFLKILESNQCSVFGDYGKYINVQVNRSLFIFAGAFNNEPDIDLDRLRAFGLKTEFLGRVGLIFNTANLSIDDLFKIVDNSDLLKKYCLLYNEDFEYTSSLIKGYVQKYYENNTLGARMIHTLIHQYFINGGVLNLDKVIKQSSFQKKLSFNKG